MVVTCTSCAAELTIPDEKVPQSAVFKVTCPKCQEKIQVATRQEGNVVAPAATVTLPSQPAPRTVVTVPAEDGGAVPLPDDDFVENRRLAMVCFDQPELQATANAALKGLGYTVHVPTKPADAIERLRQNRYEVVLLDEEYGGLEDHNLLLQMIQSMVMPLRRHMCVGLVGKRFHTFDNMMAFAKSVNFVIGTRELSKLKPIVRQAVTENDQFYRVFRESLHEAGKL